MNDTAINAKIQALISQRDDALNRFVNLCGELAMKEERIKQLEAQIAEKEERIKQLEAQIAELTEHKTDA